MRFLKELAVAANIAIVCTIHQPSSAVYNGFDRVMLLSGRGFHSSTFLLTLSMFVGFVGWFQRQERLRLS
jgi:ABC-type multidrug transport system ATPase subunit